MDSPESYESHGFFMQANNIDLSVTLRDDDDDVKVPL